MTSRENHFFHSLLAVFAFCAGLLPGRAGREALRGLCLHRRHSSGRLGGQRSRAFCQARPRRRAFVHRRQQGGTSLLGGDTPIVTVGGPSAIAARLGGSDVILIAHIFDTILYSLMVTPDIRSLADLKGKKIGASRFGSATDFSLRYVLRHYGIDPVKDVVIFQIGGQAETLAALRAGSIQGGVIASPATAEAKRLGMKELVNMATLGVPYPQTAIATTDRFLRDNRDTVVRFTRGYVDGIRRFLADREFSLRVIAKYTKIQSRPTLEATYDDYAPYVKKEPAPSAGSVQTVLDQLSATDPRARGARPQAFVDGSVIEQLAREGFFQ